MSRNELGNWIFVGAMAATVVGTLVLAHVYRVDWVRERLLSEDATYWTRVSAMLPVAVPVYVLAGLLFSFLRK